MAGQQQNDSSNDALYVGGFILLLYVILLAFFGETLTAWHLKTREGWAAVADWLLPGKKYETLRTVIDMYAPREWLERKGMLAQLSKDLRLVMFVPLATLFGFYAFRVWSKNPAKGLRRKHDRVSLIRSEVRVWPWIAPVVKLDLVKESIDEGKWAMARMPVDFAKKYRLLDGREINKLRTEKLFASQLGKLWEGPDRMPRHARALFACFIAQACRDKDGARDGLRALALSTAEGKPDYGFADVLIKKHINDERLQPIFEKHAYVITVMSAALELARKNGVLPPAYFLWLRPLNRSMWYALNNVGRRTPFPEIAGVHAHYLAEKVAGHRIERPYVVEAVKALERALREYKFD